MKIRFSERKDLTKIIALCELHAVYEKAPFDATNKATLLSEHLFNNTNTLKCLVVLINEKIIGYATFMKQFSTWDASFYIYLDCLFFTEEVRGKGFGSLVMETIKKYAKTENCTRIEWQTPDFNVNAIMFYQKLGAASKTKERFYWDV